MTGGASCHKLLHPSICKPGGPSRQCHAPSLYKWRSEAQRRQSTCPKSHHRSVMRLGLRSRFQLFIYPIIFFFFSYHLPSSKTDTWDTEINLYSFNKYLYKTDYSASHYSKHFRNIISFNPPRTLKASFIIPNLQTRRLKLQELK